VETGYLTPSSSTLRPTRMTVWLHILCCTGQHLPPLGQMPELSNKSVEAVLLSVHLCIWWDYERISIGNRHFWSWVGQFDPKFQVQGNVPHQPFFLCRKTRWIFLSCGIRMSAELSFVLSQFTRLTDGQVADDSKTVHMRSQSHSKKTVLTCLD